MARLVGLACAASALMWAGSANAAVTVQQNFAVYGLGAPATPAAPSFIEGIDPTLGTLLSITINTTFSVFANATGSTGAPSTAVYFSSPGLSFSQSSGIGTPSIAFGYATLSQYTSTLSASASASYLYTVNPATYDLFSASHIDIALLGGNGSSSTGTGFTTSNSGIGTVTYTYDGAATPAVPEPATWAMMIAGFGFIGAAMRRRKPRTAVRYA